VGVGSRRPRATALAGHYGSAEEMGGGDDILSWIDQNRRLSKDYERLPKSSEAFVYVAMSRLMARRLVRS
jgi:transposase